MTGISRLILFLNIVFLSVIVKADASVQSRSVLSACSIADPEPRLRPFCAALKLDYENFSKLVGQGFTTSEAGEFSLIGYVSMLDDERFLSLLLKEGANPNQLSPSSETVLVAPIFYSVFADNSTSLKLLIDYGAEINLRNKAGQTPLLYASTLLHFHQVHNLLVEGADYSIQSASGYDLVDVLGNAYVGEGTSAAYWRKKVIEFLKGRGLDFEYTETLD